MKQVTASCSRHQWEFKIVLKSIEVQCRGGGVAVVPLDGDGELVHLQAAKTLRDPGLCGRGLVVQLGQPAGHLALPHLPLPGPLRHHARLRRLDVEDGKVGLVAEGDGAPELQLDALPLIQESEDGTGGVVRQGRLGLDGDLKSTAITVVCSLVDK